MRWVLGPRIWRQYDRIKIKVVKGSQGNLQDPLQSTLLTTVVFAERFSWSIRTPSLILIPLGALPSILYTFGSNQSRRSALLTDLLALSFSFNALSFLTLDSFKTGCILLSGLFLYDVWWVFGTEVVSTRTAAHTRNGILKTVS